MSDPQRQQNFMISIVLVMAGIIGLLCTVVLLSIGDCQLGLSILSGSIALLGIGAWLGYKALS